MTSKRHPFHPQAVELYRKIEASGDDYPARRAMVIELASVFQRIHDDSNPDIDSDLHALVEDYEAAKLAYQHASLRLGRAAYNIMENCDADGIFDDESAEPPN